VGVVQIASALKVVALPLVLFIATSHSSRVSPVDELSDDVLTLTPVLTDGVKAPPPIATIPAGHVATCCCCVAFGKAVSAEIT
jgi:hypothetical protein